MPKPLLYTETITLKISKTQKKTLDKFDIIRKLETIRTQLTNIKNEI